MMQGKRPRLPLLRAGAALFTMLLLCGAIWGWLRSSENQAPAVMPLQAGEKSFAPELRFLAEQNASGKIFSLGSLPGPVLVHFWASWCGPCVQELPELARQLSVLKALGLSLVVISEDTDWQVVNRFLARNPELAPLKLQSTFLLDSAHKAAGEFQSSEYPETFLLDRERKIVHRFTGAQAWSHPEMRAFLSESSRPESPSLR